MNPDGASVRPLSSLLRRTGRRDTGPRSPGVEWPAAGAELKALSESR